MGLCLNGVKVLDVTLWGAGPFCSRLLAELGAEVIHLEPPSGPAIALREIPYKAKQVDYFTLALGANKKYVTLNLRHEKGRDIFRKLIAKVDILIDSYSPRTLEKFGFPYDRISEINPGLIYATITAYGYTGPYRDLPGMDNLIQAMGGLMSVTGSPDGPPMRAGVIVFDYLSGALTAAGILAALHHKVRTGRGQWLDLAMYDTAIPLLTEWLTVYFTTGTLPDRVGNRVFLNPLSNSFRTSDGYIYIASGIHWAELCKAMGRPDLIEHPNYRTYTERLRHVDELEKLVADWCRSKGLEEVLEALRKAGAPAAPINTLDRVVRDPQVKARDMLVDIEHQTTGKVKIPGSVFKMSETPGRILTPGLPLGFHNEEVYSKLLGYSKEDILKLEQHGIL